MIIKIKDQVDKVINRNAIGLFFEDINYGLDGGLHAEMLENRAFEFVEAYGGDKIYHTRPAGMYGWYPYPKEDAASRVKLSEACPRSDKHPHYLVVRGEQPGASFSNKAYDGIYMQAGTEYIVTIYAKADTYKGAITVSVREGGVTIVSHAITVAGGDSWEQYTVTFTASQTVTKGDFVITLEKEGEVCFDYISMLPATAVLGLFRADLVEKMRQLKPGFLRFPGGCVVEGANLANRYRWKDSIGALEERVPNWNRWAVHDNIYPEGEKIRYSYYNQTLGIGFYELFLLSEYLGAKPLPILSTGIACQFQSEEKVDLQHEDFLEYIQDALDLIEFANGDAGTNWGRKRIEMGHPQPFGLELLGIGNEQWETEQIDFYDRYRLFEQEIHKKYPQIKLIGTSGPDITSEKYTSAWDFYYAELEKNPNFVYAVDEHYYMSPEWFQNNVHFYDNYSRKIKVFAGEYAAHAGNGMNRPELNHWGAALSEAAFMIGLEQNGDLIEYASYAPLLARKGYAQWSPDLIWFDGVNSYGTPSYYVQVLFSELRGDHIIKTEAMTETMAETMTEMDVEEIHSSVTASAETNTVYIKIVNTKPVKESITLELDFMVEELGELIVMTGGAEEVNSLEEPYCVTPQKNSLRVTNHMKLELQPQSLSIIVLKKKK